jgi:hypothetical protein
MPHREVFLDRETMVMTTRSDPQLKIRLPLNLKRQLKQRVKENNRSTSAEIVFRLERSFENEQTKSSE